MKKSLITLNLYIPSIATKRELLKRAKEFGLSPSKFMVEAGLNYSPPKPDKYLSYDPI